MNDLGFIIAKYKKNGIIIIIFFLCLIFFTFSCLKNSVNLYPVSDSDNDTYKPIIKINPIDNAKMIYIPSGEFTMGALPDDEEALENEKPAREVYLDGYFIYNYEVTYRQFKRFLEETGYEPIGNWNRFNKPEFLDHPVMNVTFVDAQAYCQWAGVSLPTEAQWEKAARGIDGRKYPWGNHWDSNLCNNIETDNPDYLSKMNPILGERGSMPAGSVTGDVSPYGVMDMAGNINEWCLDLYSSTYYKEGETRNPQGPSEGTERSIRGGSWSLPSRRCRVTARWSGSITSRLDDYGFRCVFVPEEEI